MINNQWITIHGIRNTFRGKEKYYRRIQSMNDKSFMIHLTTMSAKKTIYLLTYLLTPWSRVLLEKLTGFAANQESPRILWSPKVHYRTHKRPPPVPILSQLHPVPTTPSHFLKLHINIILPSTSWSPQWSLYFRFPHQNLVPKETIYIYYLFCANKCIHIKILNYITYIWYIILHIYVQLLVQNE